MGIAALVASCSSNGDRHAYEFPSLASAHAELSHHPWGLVFPVIAIAGLLGIKWFTRTRQEGSAFLASCAYIVGMLTSVAFSLYPNVLPASTNPMFSLTIANSKAADYGLKIGLIWWVSAWRL